MTGDCNCTSGWTGLYCEQGQLDMSSNIAVVKLMHNIADILHMEHAYLELVS